MWMWSWRILQWNLFVSLYIACGYTVYITCCYTVYNIACCYTVYITCCYTVYNISCCYTAYNIACCYTVCLQKSAVYVRSKRWCTCVPCRTVVCTHWRVISTLVKCCLHITGKRSPVLCTQYINTNWMPFAEHSVSPSVLRNVRNVFQATLASHGQTDATFSI